MKWLLPRAEKLIADLSEHDRAKVIESFSRPIAASRCHPVENGKRPGVFKYRVTRNLRVCFWLEEKLGIMVFLGDHHECRRFVDKDGGEVTGRLLPIEDSIIMSMDKNGNDNKPGPSAAPSPAEPPLGFADCMRMLPGVIDTTFGQKVRQAEDASLALMAGITSQVERLNQVIPGLTTSVDTLAVQLADVTVRVEGLQGRVESQAQQIATGVATLTKAFHETDQRTHSFRHECRTKTAALEGDLRALEGQVCDQECRSAEQLESLSLELRGLSEKHDGVHRSLGDVLVQFQESDRTNKAFHEEVKRRLADLEARDPASPLVARLDRQDEMLDREDPAIGGAVADLARCFQKISALGADLAQLKGIALDIGRRLSDRDATVGAVSDQVDSLVRDRALRERRTLKARLSRWVAGLGRAIRSGRIHHGGHQETSGSLGRGIRPRPERLPTVSSFDDYREAQP
jgi:hypothetical protein